MPPKESSLPRARLGEFLDAFALIELLTVISIIGALATILIPVVSGVPNKAHASNGLVNLYSIGTSFQLCASNNRSLYPAPRYRASSPGNTNPSKKYSMIEPNRYRACGVKAPGKICRYLRDDPLESLITLQTLQPVRLAALSRFFHCFPPAPKG